MLIAGKIWGLSDMKLIHIIHRLTKLFTLKHSCFLANFTLKHSCVYAETLLISIYTCIYLYQKTCSWQQQVVNNLFSKKIKAIKFIFALMTTASLTGCQQTIWVSALKLPELRVNQQPETATQPAKYFVCGNDQYPCRNVTHKWQALIIHHPAKHKSLTSHQSKLIINKPKEHQHALPTKTKSCHVKSD